MPLDGRNLLSHGYINDSVFKFRLNLGTYTSASLSNDVVMQDMKALNNT